MKLTIPVDVNKYPVSQWFGVCNASTCPFYEELGLLAHNGIDFKTPMKTPIKSAHAGTLTSGISKDGNWWIMIENIELGLKTFYCHLSEFKITSGTYVKEGVVIGLSGNSGKYTTGPHLHFGLYEINASGNIKNYGNGYHGAIDPSPYLATKYKNGTLAKTIYEPKVYLIQYGTKWWLKDEETFKRFMDYSVGKAKIKEMDLFTYRSYPAGEIRFIEGTNKT